MYKILLSFTLILTLGCKVFGQNAVDTLCSNAATQRETEECLLLSFDKSNQQLQIVYNKIVNRLQKTHRLKSAISVAESQKRWLLYRDQYVNVWSELYLGGSSQSVMKLDCKIRMTYFRIQELRVLYDELYK